MLRNVTEEDLPIFFEHQRDAVALRMAAFSSRERDASLTHWRANVQVRAAGPGAVSGTSSCRTMSPSAARWNVRTAEWVRVRRAGSPRSPKSVRTGRSMQGILDQRSPP